MEDRRFDAVAKSLAVPADRRRVAAGLVAGALALVGRDRAAARTCTGFGAICREHANCCSKYCGPKDRTSRRRCQCDANADCPAGFACAQGACVEVCQASGDCTPGVSECCPGYDCSGCLTPNAVCQDCSAAPTVAGNACGATQGNQCCGGDPNCFVGVTVGGTPVCVNSGDCQIVAPCTDSAGCDPGKICIRNDAPSEVCCFGDPPPATICANPCGGTG